MLDAMDIWQWALSACALSLFCRKRVFVTRQALGTFFAVCATRTRLARRTECVWLFARLARSACCAAVIQNVGRGALLTRARGRVRGARALDTLSVIGIRLPARRTFRARDMICIYYVGTSDTLHAELRVRRADA
jgi:hypothetical protein